MIGVNGLRVCTYFAELDGTRYVSRLHDHYIYWCFGLLARISVSDLSRSPGGFREYTRQFSQRRSPPYR